MADGKKVTLFFLQYHGFFFAEHFVVPGSILKKR